MKLAAGGQRQVVGMQASPPPQSAYMSPGGQLSSTDLGGGWSTATTAGVALSATSADDVKPAATDSR